MPGTKTAARIFDKKRGVINTSNIGTVTEDIAIPYQSATSFILKVSARDTTAGTSYGAFFIKAGTISNPDNSTCILNGSADMITPIIAAGLAGCTLSVSANGTNLRISVTPPISGDPMYWQYEIEMIVN